MRSWLRRRQWVRALGAAPLLAYGPGAAASDATGVLWDDRHMQTNIARLREPSTRPPIQIGEPAPPATHVVETILPLRSLRPPRARRPEAPPADTAWRASFTQSSHRPHAAPGSPPQ